MINNNLRIDNAHIIFRNFSGMEGRFNPAGKRNFCVVLDDMQAEALLDDGWPVKYLKPRDDDSDPQPYIKVNISFDNYPPKAVLITSRGKTPLNENTIGMLDWAEIKNVDMILRPYNWEVGGKSGTTPYVKSIYVTISEDELEQKYADVPDSAMSSMMTC